MRNQQLDLPRIIEKNQARYPHVERWAREVIPERTVYTKSCAFYLGTDRMKLSSNTTLDFQKEVYFNAQSRIQAAQLDPTADPAVLGIHLYQAGGVKAMIDVNEIESEENMADGEPGDFSAMVATETLTHSTLKTLLMDQRTEELQYLQDQVDMVNFQRSESPPSSQESLRIKRIMRITTLKRI